MWDLREEDLEALVAFVLDVDTQQETTVDKIRRLIEGYTWAIEVERSDSGMYSFRGGAIDWHSVRTELELTELMDYGTLRGWPGWERVVSVIDRDGLQRWYFLGNLTE